MKNLKILALILGAALLAVSCSPSKPDPRGLDQFLTLADVVGRTSFKEDSPDVRVINVKTKALIKRGDLMAAKQKAMGIAATQAVDVMVRELLSPSIYNREFPKIDNYFSKNIDKFILARETNGEKRIYLDKFYGISASFKLSRQAVLVALQKDLKLIDTSHTTLITVVTSPKDLDLSVFGMKFQDVENSFLNQAQTDLNQRGLRAMDHRNAIVSLKSDPARRKQFERMTKKDFMVMIEGAKPGQSALATQGAKAERYYATGLSLLKQLASVVVEVNILSVGKRNRTMTLSVSVTAKNISTGTGGAFANSTFTVARLTGSNTVPSAMITGLIKDVYEKMKQEFIPQVIKEMSVIDANGNKLAPFEIVLKGFGSSETRQIRRSIERMQSDDFRYIDVDNTLSRSVPPMTILLVRYTNKASKLADKVYDVMDRHKIKVHEPIVAPGITDVVFTKIPKD